MTEHSPVPQKVSKIKITIPFDKAILAIIEGKKVRRLEWGDSEEYGVMQDSYLMIHRNNKFHTWIVSEGDLLAKDWVIIK